jgi:hypothetical protein
MALRGGRKGKENDRESTVSKCITSVQVEDIAPALKAVNQCLAF